MEIPWAIGETKVEMVFMQFEQRDPLNIEMQGWIAVFKY